MKECKYRLPCNWCDKLNKYCDMIEPIVIKPIECEHTWIYDKSMIYTSGQIDYYHCARCGAKKAVDGDVTYESSNEWQT